MPDLTSTPPDKKTDPSSAAKVALLQDALSVPPVAPPTSEPMVKAEDVTIADFSGVLSHYELMFHEMYIIEQPLSGKKILIVQPFWLDSVDDSRLDTSWGQHVGEYPPNLSKLFKEMFPAVHLQDRVSFRQVKRLREECIKTLKENRHYEVLEGTCGSMKALPHTENTLQLHISMTDGVDHQYEIESTARIFNFSQVPRPLTHPLKHLPPQTEIYAYKQGNEPKRMILFGSGLSTVWIKEQSPGSDIKVVLRNAASTLPKEIGRNTVKITREQCLYMDQIDFLLVNSIMESENPRDSMRKKALTEFALANQIELLSELNYLAAFKATPAAGAAEDTLEDALDEPLSEEVLAIGIGYNATGFVPNESICRDIPTQMVFYPIDPKTAATSFYAPKNIPAGAFFERHEQFKRKMMGITFNVLDVNLQALVITETDKPLLATELQVPLDFINYLCADITKLEDTPPNAETYIKEKYTEWTKKTSVVVDSQFDERVHTLLDGMATRAEKKPVISLQ